MQEKLIVVHRKYGVRVLMNKQLQMRAVYMRRCLVEDIVAKVGADLLKISLKRCILLIASTVDSPLGRYDLPRLL